MHQHRTGNTALEETTLKWEYRASVRVGRAGCFPETDGQGAQMLETSVKRHWGEAYKKALWRSRDPAQSKGEMRETEPMGTQQ